MLTEPINILLADNNFNNRLFFFDILKELKIKTCIQCVDDGTELIEYLNNADNDLPHLLFLDINISSTNEFECLKKIKANDNWKDIVIAIFSTSSADNDIEDALIIGANVFINKPNCYDKLKEILQRVITITYTSQFMFF